MKLDELWDELLTRSKYLGESTKKFIFQLGVWGLGIIIIAIFAAKEFCQKKIELIRGR